MVNCFVHSEIPANIIRRNYSPSRGWGSNLSLAIFHPVLFFSRISLQRIRDAWLSVPPLTAASKILAFLCVRLLILCKLVGGFLGWNLRILLLFKDDPRARFYQFPNPTVEKRENSFELKDNLGQGGSVTDGSEGRKASCCLYWTGWECGRKDGLLYLSAEHLIVCHHQKIITREQFYLTHIDF